MADAQLNDETADDAVTWGEDMSWRPFHQGRRVCARIGASLAASGSKPRSASDVHWSRPIASTQLPFTQSLATIALSSMPPFTSCRRRVLRYDGFLKKAKK